MPIFEYIYMYIYMPNSVIHNIIVRQRGLHVAAASFLNEPVCHPRFLTDLLVSQVKEVADCKLT